MNGPKNYTIKLEVEKMRHGRKDWAAKLKKKKPGRRKQNYISS